MNRISTLTGILFLAARLAWAQAPAAAERKTPDRAAAYYHFSMAHLYEQLAREYRSMEYVNKAIEEYKLALRADPSSEYVSSELVDLYAQSGRLNDAVKEAEAILERDPKNLQMRRLLGRVYRGYLADPAQGRVNEDLLRRAVEQYEKILEQEPGDVESRLHAAALYRVSRDSVKAEAALKKALEIEPNSEEALSSLASLYADIGDTPGAIEMLTRAAGKKPNAKILTALGAAYERAGQHDKAVEALEKALQLDRNNVEARRSLAQNLLVSEQHDKALIQYQALAQQDPQDYQNHLRLAQIYRHKRAFEQARASLQRAAALSSDSVEVPYTEVLLLETEGKTDQAVEALQKVLESTVKPDPANYTARDRTNRAFFFEKLGMLERGRENFLGAEKAFRAMTETDPESAPRASVQLIETFRASREFERARTESEAAVKKHPQDRSLAIVRASVLADLGEARQGAALLRSLLKNDVNDRDVLLAIAQVCEKGKLFAEAREAVEKAREYAQTKDQKRSVYFVWGSLLERQKLYEEAEQQFRQVLEIDPDDASALNYLGYMLADRNVRLEEAHAMIKKAVDLDPDNGAYLDSLGWVYYRQNKFDQAEEWLRRASEKASRDPTVHDHLGDVYLKQGKLRLALEQWQRSLREWEQSSRAEANPEEIERVRKKLDGVRGRLAREQSSKTPPPRN